MLNHDGLVYHYNLALAQHHGEGAAVSLQSALQCGLWYNTIASAEQEHIYEPQAVLAQWQGMDNRDLYTRHINDPAARARLAEYGWLDTTIDYHINSWGFRSNREYVSIDEPCLVVLGCSFTFGTGLHEHQTWGRVLANRLGLGLVNLAVPGHGLDLGSLWLLLEGHNIRNPRAVCVFEPPMGRLSWLAAMNETVVCAECLRDMCQQHPRIIRTLLLNSTASNIKNYHIIKSWAEQRGAAFAWDNRIHNNVTHARDLAHHGPEWHVTTAEDFYTHLKNT